MSSGFYNKERIRKVSVYISMVIFIVFSLLQGRYERSKYYVIVEQIHSFSFDMSRPGLLLPRGGGSDARQGLGIIAFISGVIFL